jgi:hypothetical protein
MTLLTESQLVALRQQAQQQKTRFVDPHIIARCCQILDRRGEVWARAVLGRDISRRSPGVPNRPYLRDGEPNALVLADTAEDAIVLHARD